MNKVIFSASIPILLILICYFSYVNLTYMPPKEDKDIEAITGTIISNAEEKPAAASFKSSARPPLPSSIWTNNIFNPDRATSSASGTVTSLKDMTLVGVFGDETKAGAVFITGLPQSQAGTSPANTQIQAAQPPRAKMVFLVGDKLSNGYILKSVSRDSATLQGTAGDVTLQLDFTDEARTKRILETQKNNTNIQVRIIETQQQGGSSSKGGVSSHSSVIRDTTN